MAAKYHYDLSGGEPIIRDLPIHGSNDILKGSVVARDGAISTALNNFGYTRANPATLDDVVGVTNELWDASVNTNNIGTIAVTAAATGVQNYMKVIINPQAVYLTEWSQLAANDTVNTAADTTGKTVTGTFTSPGDDFEGNWVYITNQGSTAGGAGNLFQIGAASTTVWTAVTQFDDNLAGNNTSDTYIVIQRPYSANVAGGSMNLSAQTSDYDAAILGNDIVGDDTGAAIVLENYVADAATPMEPLRSERTSGKTYDASTCKIYGDLYLMDNICNGGALATQPLIT